MDNNLNNNLKNEKSKKSKTKLNNTDKITLHYMTNPMYNNVVSKDSNQNISKLKVEEKREQIIFFKKNILNFTKKLFEAFENNEKIKVHDNVYQSFNNYLYNAISYIEHKKTSKSVKEELGEFNTSNNNTNNHNTNNTDNHNDNHTDNHNHNDEYINTIMQAKNDNNQMNKFVKITNLSKKNQKIIPNKKNIYK